MSEQPARTAVYTGMFDPVHLGHMDVIRRGSRLFDRLVIGVGANPEKQPFFTPEERVELLRRVAKPYTNVEVQSFRGLAVKFVREVGHPGLTELRVVPTMHERKALMAGYADAFIALPGGFGTFDELCEMMTWDQLGIHAKPIALINVEGYFDGFLAQIDRAVEDGLVKPEHRTMLAVVATVGEALAAIDAWHAPDVPKWLQGGTPKP